jgi:hypothetical protein
MEQLRCGSLYYPKYFRLSITGKFRRHRFTADCIALIRFCNKVITSTLSRLIRLKGIQNLAGRFLRKENLIPLIPRHKGTGTGLTGF